jgi:hypothetical protein
MYVYLPEPIGSFLERIVPFEYKLVNLNRRLSQIIFCQYFL